MLRSRRLWLVVLALLLVGGGFALWRQRAPGVGVTLEPVFPALGHPARPVTVRLAAPSAAIVSLEVRVVQQGTVRTVLREDLAAAGPRTLERPVALEAKALGLAEGPAELHVLARDGLWRPRQDPAPRLVHRFTVDLTPPTLEMRAVTGYVRHTGAGIAIYRVAGAARSGIQVGSAFFPGESGLASDPAVHVALFTIPWSDPPAVPSAVAEDEAGNQRVIGLPVRILPGRFPKDQIRLTEAFLRRKVPELAPQTPGTASAAELAEAFLEVNRAGRQAAETRIRELAGEASTPKPLWEGAFVQQPNTKVFATFPEARTYFVDGREVDRQWHLGIDLASRARSPIGASNAGRVVFAGPNGLYGNTVILDHGLGLGSLYAHLSEIGVKEGQAVTKGEILGRSGETGFAGGDHLHFAILIRGVYASPIEWWDEKWIRDRIAQPLEEAGIALPGVTTGEAPASPTAAPGRSGS